MKKGCILLNVSRGGLVENAALVSGLESSQLGGVGMDVYENEGRCVAASGPELAGQQGHGSPKAECTCSTQSSNHDVGAAAGPNWFISASYSALP